MQVLSHLQLKLVESDAFELLINFPGLLVLILVQPICYFFLVSALLRVAYGQLFHEVVARVPIFALKLHFKVRAAFLCRALVDHVSIG